MPAFRHLCWTLGRAAVLLLPRVATVMPRVDVDVLPNRGAGAPMAILTASSDDEAVLERPLEAPAHLPEVPVRQAATFRFC